MSTARAHDGWVFEVTDAVGVANPDGGPRMFFFIAAKLGEHMSLWVLDLLGPVEDSDPPRVRVLAKHKACGAPELWLRWDVIFHYMDACEDGVVSATGGRHERVGIGRGPRGQEHQGTILVWAGLTWRSDCLSPDDRVVGGGSGKSSLTRAVRGRAS